MASNAFGQCFRITTWGESHGKAIGVVIDGCPAGLPLNDAIINADLQLRRPGQNPFTSPRNEHDHAEIYSGVFENKSTGAPISIIIHNKDADSPSYTAIKDLFRPGHANYGYLKKYGIFDYRGGGRASARETACRVAAAAVAKQLLNRAQIKLGASIKSIGHITAEFSPESIPDNRDAIYANPLYCLDATATKQIMEALKTVVESGDSLGGIVQFAANGVPTGLGDPIYEKLDAKLATAMLSIPASKGFAMGTGFGAARMRGSEHNDRFIREDDRIRLTSNHAGGTLGGISTNTCLTGTVAFKPTSSIKQAQSTVDIAGNEQIIQLAKNARHDPCVAIRAVPVVEAMLALVLADALLMSRLDKA